MSVINGFEDELIEEATMPAHSLFMKGTMNPFVLIIGGGLAGLTAARLLHRADISFQLLEARDRLGGRILSADASGNVSADGFDLGPSWFWPGMQPAMAELVAELGIATFPQNIDGDVVFQRARHEGPQHYSGMRQEPPSMRIAGGTGTLISALASDLPVGSIQIESRVTKITLDGEEIELRFVRPDELERSIRASHVVIAMPPRLLASTVSFSPALNEQTLQHWRDTPTWMASHAKVFALYDRPFWRDAGLSGTAQSMVGPLVEIHDATTAAGGAALFGFVGVSAAQRKAAGADAIVSASVRQLAALFGPEAARPVATLFKDWAADPLTATAADQIASGHPVHDLRSWLKGEWHTYVLLAGSETSSTQPGYLAGAVEAAQRAVGDLIAGLSAAKATKPSHRYFND